MKPKYPLHVPMDSLQSVQTGLPETHEIPVSDAEKDTAILPRSRFNPPEDEATLPTSARWMRSGVQPQEEEATLVTPPPFVSPEPPVFSDEWLPKHAPNQSESSAETTEPTVSVQTIVPERASFALRAIALIIDGLGIMGLAYLLVFVSESLMQVVLEQNTSDSANRINPQEVRDFLIHIAPSFVWFVWEGIWGTSLGKVVVGLRVRAEDGTPARRSALWWRALRRHPSLFMLLGYLIHLPVSSLVMVWIAVVCDGIVRAMSGIFLFGCLFALSSSRQAWHDKVTKTAVFRSR